MPEGLGKNLPNEQGQWISAARLVYNRFKPGRPVGEKGGSTPLSGGRHGQI